ncbi:MAG: hypothetical protein ACOH1Y_14425 [Propionicimonas sp.]
MKRVVVGVVVLLLALAGCSQVLGTADWDRVEASYSGDSGAYTLVVTPTEASYTIGGKESSQKLPDGVWTTLTTGVRALGAREATTCAKGESVQIAAKAGSAVKQSFAANSCDAGDAMKQAKAILDQVIALIK